MSNVGPALIQVSKRDKSREPLNLEKLHKVVFYACRGITGVSASEIEIRSSFQFYSGIKTSDIQETLIKSAADLISEETPGYQYVGGKLINYHLRKIVYKQFRPWHIYKLIKRNVEIGYYDNALLTEYSEEECRITGKTYSVALKVNLKLTVGIDPKSAVKLICASDLGDEIPSVLT